MLDLKNFFQDSGFFFNKLQFFLNSGLTNKKEKLGFFFSKLRFFQSHVLLKKKKQSSIIVNNAHVIYLLTTIVGSKKMNKMASMIQMVLFVSFCAFHVQRALIMPLYTCIPVKSGNSDRNSSIECYFNLGLWTTQKS